MKDKKRICDKALPKAGMRAPMMIDQNGDVVFAPPPLHHNDKPRDVHSSKHPKKPTPLMLCNEISKMFKNTIRNSVEDQRIQGSYREIIFHLAHEDARTQLELARLTHLKPPTVSVALGKLEDEGYVIRKADALDARCTRVYLTDKGKAIDEKSHKVIEHLDSKALCGFSEDEIRQLMVLLFRVRENIADDEE